MTPKEIAEELRAALGRVEQCSGISAIRNNVDAVSTLLHENIPTILAALDAYDKIESFANWLALYPEDLRLANCKFRELFHWKPLPKPPEEK